MKDVEIRYSNAPFYAGHFLRGYVCFNLKEPIKLRDVAIWVEGQTKVTIPGDTTDEKWLLRTEVNLGMYLSQYDYRLPAGFHQIPFTFPIPQMLPSSFGEKHGYIYYCCRLTVNGRSKTYKSFTVIGIEDLNWHPYASLPINIKVQKQINTDKFAYKRSYTVFEHSRSIVQLVIGVFGIPLSKCCITHKLDKRLDNIQIIRR